MIFRKETQFGSNHIDENKFLSRPQQRKKNVKIEKYSLPIYDSDADALEKNL